MLVFALMGPDSDDVPDITDANRLTPEERRGPRTLQVALFLLAALLLVSVATNPAAVLPRDSTLAGDHHLDEESGLEIAVPVGWRVKSGPDFGSVEMVPTGSSGSHGTRILAGRLEPGNAAAAIDDDRQAAITLAETVQQYVLQVDGTRDEQRTAEVRNEAGGGRSISYIVVPSVLHQEDEGGLVYTAVFGEGDERWWLAYLTDTQRSAPGSPWVDRIVNDIRLAG